MAWVLGRKLWGIYLSVGRSLPTPNLQVDALALTSEYNFRRLIPMFVLMGAIAGVAGINSRPLYRRTLPDEADCAAAC